ncbi:MAG: hypothetical protein CMB80_26035 [Flammeovirgaceae bacterium]|nr:hypothetical protein [Flammeovirgaceae bacterium]MBE62934.1 hypothetical protein [Flammeovirgaceae bacterium]HCX21059.1 hypothetical protein [Cytophagales bacterium]|tara:strand:+ start:15441 stop:15716 length:276 start_codon:yes stop_codon:yes gene_type:complete
MKDLSNTDEYKKAYERADRICRFMPHLIDKMSSPEDEPPAHRQAFEDRITELQIERDRANNFSRKALFEKYGSKLNRYEVNRLKDQYRERD